MITYEILPKIYCVNTSTDITSDTLVVYHDNCSDGLMALYNYLVYRGTPTAVLAGDHKTAANDLRKCLDEAQGAISKVVFVDFSLAPYMLDSIITEFMLASVIVYDHHITAIEAYANARQLFNADKITTHFDLNHSGAGLVAKLVGTATEDQAKLTAYVEDQDLWKFELPDTKAIGLCINNMRNAPLYRQLKVIHGTCINVPILSIEGLIVIGNELLTKFEEQAAAYATNLFIYNNMAYTCCPYKYVSEVGNLVAQATERAVVIVSFEELEAAAKTMREDFLISPTIYLAVSLRSIGDIDVSKIAMQHQGGGHKNAAGCTLGFSEDMLTSLPNLPESVRKML